MGPVSAGMFECIQNQHAFVFVRRPMPEPRTFESVEETSVVGMIAAI